MNKPTILIAEGDEILRQKLRSLLHPKSFDLISSYEIEDIVKLLQYDKMKVVISCSAHKLTKDVLQTTKRIRRHSLHIPIILITRYSSEEMAIAALRAGVSDYFKMPFSEEAVLESIHRNISKSLPRNSYIPDSDITSRYPGRPIIGMSPSMEEIKRYLFKVALTDSTVLISGETGTGKELVAELIHNHGMRYKKPFICINCAALPENLIESELFGYSRGAFTGAIAAKPGKFVMAEGGSVFLDEIGDMSPFAQAKILRCIESKEVYPLGGKKVIPIDIRIIAATNQDPEGLMAEGKFREDLYYRLNVARIHIPPLRERKEDISSLIAYAVEKMNRRFDRNIKGLTDETMAILYRYNWPGNIRELMNLIESVFINLPSHHNDFVDLPRQLKQRLNISENASRDERNLVVSTLLKTKWNKSKAAQKLNWSRTTIYRKIAEYNIVEKRNPER